MIFHGMIKKTLICSIMILPLIKLFKRSLISFILIAEDIARFFYSVWLPGQYLRYGRLGAHFGEKPGKGAAAAGFTITHTPSQQIKIYTKILCWAIVLEKKIKSASFYSIVKLKFRQKSWTHFVKELGVLKKLFLRAVALVVGGLESRP